MNFLKLAVRTLIKQYTKQIQEAISGVNNGITKFPLNNLNSCNHLQTKYDDAMYDVLDVEIHLFSTTFA